MDDGRTSATEPRTETKVLTIVPSVTEFSVSRVVSVIHDKWRLILPITLASGILGLSIALWMPSNYKAQSVLVLISDPANPGLNQIAAASGLANLPGVTLPMTNFRAEAIATLTSAELIMQYIKEKDLLPLLFEQQWDAEHSHWKAKDPKRIPTLWSGWKRLLGAYDVKDDKKTGLITVSLSWRSPQLAAMWVNDLIARANERLRERTIQASERHLKYLEDEITRTSNFELHQAISRLMENELKELMITKGTVEYRLRVVDHAFPPEKKSPPTPAQIILLSLLLGFAGGLALAWPRTR